MVWKGGTKAVRCTKQLFQAGGAMEERGGGGDGHLLHFLLLFPLIRNGLCMWRLVGCDVDWWTGWEEWHSWHLWSRQLLQLQFKSTHLFQPASLNPFLLFSCSIACSINNFFRTAGWNMNSSSIENSCNFAVKLLYKVSRLQLYVLSRHLRVKSGFLVCGKDRWLE